jgi:DNA-binding LytR/AlgR family response regulator
MVKLPVEEIRCIYIIENVVLARTDQSGDFVVDMALDQLKSILDPQFFFRINRQLIASRAACKSYSDAGHGKLSVTLEPAPNVNTVVSQLKAKAFRSWITAIKRRDL